MGQATLKIRPDLPSHVGPATAKTIILTEEGTRLFVHQTIEERVTMRASLEGILRLVHAVVSELWITRHHALQGSRRSYETLPRNGLSQTILRRCGSSSNSMTYERPSSRNLFLPPHWATVPIDPLGDRHPHTSPQAKRKHAPPRSHVPVHEQEVVAVGYREMP
jgi:hypothetical protein